MAGYSAPLPGPSGDDQKFTTWNGKVAGLLEQLLDQWEGAEAGGPLPAHFARSPAIVAKIRAQADDFRPLDHGTTLVRLLENPATPASEVAKAVLRNPSLSGRVLRHANSAGVARLAQVNSVQSAILLLGFDNLRRIVLMEKFLNLIDVQAVGLRPYLLNVWLHSALTSTCCQSIASAFAGLDANLLATVGLLHDLGKFFLALSDLIEREADEFHYDETFTLEDEDELFGINHVSVGMLMMEAWRLPGSLAKILRLHHHLSTHDRIDLDEDQQTVAYAVALFLANEVAKAFVGAPGSGVAVKPLHYSYRHVLDPEKLRMNLTDPAFYAAMKKTMNYSLPADPRS
jgi:HD-like signal output (HDOD) protein